MEKLKELFNESTINKILVLFGTVTNESLNTVDVIKEDFVNNKFQIKDKYYITINNTYQFIVKDNQVINLNLPF